MTAGFFRKIVDNEPFNKYNNSNRYRFGGSMSLKYSRQRESIRENLINRMDHPTADMVYSDIRQIYPNISLGTVYRNLALLSDRGEIARIHTKDGTLHFDRNTEPHDHFVCRSCGRITDIEAPSAEEIKEEALKNFPGSIDECIVTFYGLCGDCVSSGSN